MGRLSDKVDRRRLVYLTASTSAALSVVLFLFDVRAVTWVATLVETTQRDYRLMCEEIFGPVVTAFVYDDSEWEDTLKVVDATSPYALTGSVFSTDRRAIQQAGLALRNAAGNFYINDKPTGAVVGQQPFGGARASGTNDKAGSKLNLMRWVSPRTIKETFSPPTDYTYPFMAEE
jgi:1-pyrroline-5-carboxylate dehydrogenase